MELEIQQCEKTKAVREEQLERLTQICQEQAVSNPQKAAEVYINLYKLHTARCSSLNNTMTHTKSKTTKQSQCGRIHA